MAQVSSVTAWFITTEPVRAFMITFAADAAGLHFEALQDAEEGDALVGRRRRTHPDHAAVERGGDVGAEMVVDRFDHAAGGEEVGGVQFEAHLVVGAEAVGDRALDRGAAGNLARR